LIVYLDSSMLARAYLADEPGHAQAVLLLEDPEIGLITGTWTRIEVSGVLVRAARAARGDETGLLALLDGDLVRMVRSPWSAQIKTWSRIGLFISSVSHLASDGLAVSGGLRRSRRRRELPIKRLVCIPSERTYCAAAKWSVNGFFSLSC
jgi:predicted nucleic acid-binding protein